MEMACACLPLGASSVEGSCPGFFEGTNWGHVCVIFVEHPNELSSSHGNLFYLSIAARKNIRNR